jgi:hypothetical protein
LWHRGQRPEIKAHPRHRTRCPYYWSRGGETTRVRRTLIFLIAVLAAVAALAHWRGGTPAVTHGFLEGWMTLVRFGPMIVVSFLAAGFADQLIPPAWVREQLGADSGLRGSRSPPRRHRHARGPVRVDAGCGGDDPHRRGRGPVVAFLSSWSLLAFHRMIAWEVPILAGASRSCATSPARRCRSVAGFAARALSR